MTLRLIGTGLVVIYFLFIFNLLKRERLSFKYTVLWLISGIVMIVILIFPQVLERLAKGLGFEIASNGFFVLCIFLIVLILISLTVIVSTLTSKLQRLIQQLAISEKRIRDLEEITYSYMAGEKEKEQN